MLSPSEENAWVVDSIFFKGLAAAAAADIHHASFVLLHPTEAAVRSDTRQWLLSLGARLVAVPWAVPPGLSSSVPVESGGRTCHTTNEAAVNAQKCEQQ
eukprot:5004101-Amphidinium_carterae.2